MRRNDEKEQNIRRHSTSAPPLTALMGNSAVLQAMMNDEDPLLGSHDPNSGEEEEDQAERRLAPAGPQLTPTQRELAQAENQLLVTYAIIYQQHNELLDALQYRLRFVLDPNAAVVPAYTEVNANVITVLFQYWFVRRSTIGQMVGMANHELAAHYLTNAVFDALRGDTLAEIAEEITNLSTDPESYHLRGWENPC